MEQFLIDQAHENVLTAWRSLKMELGKSTKRYFDKFWEANIKSSIYKRIGVAEQKQQFCAVLLDDMCAYVKAL